MSKDKSRIEDLALRGGAPLFDQPLHVGQPSVGSRQRFLARINEMLDRRWLSNNGPFVQEFETRVAEFISVRHCIAMCNGTMALELLFQALELCGEIILPSFTFVATAHAARRSGLTPVFCDIAPGSSHLDPRRVEERITSRTCAIAGVHCWGIPCAIEALAEIAARHRLKLVFDAAHAFGCSHGGKMVGGFGNAEVFSFHATKFFHSLEGGAVTTNDGELAARLRLLRNFGFTGYDQVACLGANAKMTEVCAAMGLTSFEGLQETVAWNCDVYRRYREELHDLPGLRLVVYEGSERQNYQYVAACVDEEGAGISRDLLLAILHAENVLARRYFFPGCHRLEPYRSENRDAGSALPETEKLASRILQLPAGPQMSAAHVAGVCDVIRCAIRNAEELSSGAGAGYQRFHSGVAGI
jgi:dTDP-4-amino-4,6-dideoxygalactose transaminase